MIDGRIINVRIIDGRIDQRIFDLRNLLFEKPDHNWTIKEMTKVVGLSQTSLHRLFKFYIKTTPTAFLLNRRLEWACELLEDP